MSEFKHDDVAQYHARRFAAGGGIEYDDLLQEARLAMWRAGSRYDPGLASARTYGSTCARRHLCTVVARHGRRALPTVSLFDREGDDDLIDRLAADGPAPDAHAVLMDVIRQMPEDARTVVGLVLGDAAAVAGVARAEARAVIGEALGWPADRLARAYAAIGAALRGGGEGFFRTRPVGA